MLTLLNRRALSNRGARFQFIDAPRGRLGYWTLGSGPPVVLLHGAGDQAGTWVKVAPWLSERHRVIFPDLPGHEESAPSEGPVSMGDMAEALESLLEAEVPDGRLTFVGNSMGGWAAMLYAERYPERVALLVLENAGGLAGTDIEALLAPRTREQAWELMKKTFGPELEESPEFVLDDLLQRVEDGPISRLIGADEAPFFIDGRLGGVEAPAHLVWGELDGLLPLDYGRRLARELPRSRLHVIEGCGHIPHLQRSDEFLQLLGAILDAPEEMLGADSSS